MLVAGSMIGSAIFIVPAAILRQVGSPSLLLLVWLITAVIIVFGALSYGELAVQVTALARRVCRFIVQRCAMPPVRELTNTSCCPSGENAA